MTTPVQPNANPFLFRSDRRSFMKRAALLAAMSPAAVALLGLKPDADADPLPYPMGLELDLAILNFALNLEYLEGEYYNQGAFGLSLTDQKVATTGGQGAAGEVTIKSNPQVTFVTPGLQLYAEKIAMDEVAHIKFLQSAITAFGGTYVNEPAINLVDSFNGLANNAGIAATFGPLAKEPNFYLGAFSLTDVGVTAYHGAAPFLTNKTILSSAAGILATEAYHDAVLRLTVYQAGADAITNAGKISALRDMLDDNGAVTRDQGVVDGSGNLNVTPTDANSIAFARKPGNVLNIVCGANKQRKGGFFPAGVNGPIQ